MGSYVCMAIADSMGSQVEFSDFVNDKKGIFKCQGWEDIKNYCKYNNQKRTEFGICSDDTSMGRCLADSLLANELKLVEKDLMIRFILWWNFGYNNGSQYLESFGLGGNISLSFHNFMANENQYKFNKFGDNNGNGSIMRLAPVPILFHDNIEQAMDAAGEQSMVTHNGLEAYECCRLLAFIICKLINYQGNNPKQDILDKLGEEFKLKNEVYKSVLYLAKSQQEPEEDMYKYNSVFNKNLIDRNWNWKSPNFQISPTRYFKNKGYYGSYVMDCMKIALHIVYNTDSLANAIFRAVSMGGDCDSFGSVVGQIAGAMYGLNKEVLELYLERISHFEDYSSLVKSYKLFNKKPIQTRFKLQNNKESQIQQMKENQIHYQI